MTFRKLMALLAVLAMLAAACGSDDEGDTATDDAPAASDEGDAEDDAMEASSATIDIDAILAADLDNCTDAPTGDPIKVGMAMDFGEVGGFVDVPGSQLLPYVAELINCVGGIGGTPVEVEVREVGDDAALATQELMDLGVHFFLAPRSPTSPSPSSRPRVATTPSSLRPPPNRPFLMLPTTRSS